MATVPVLYIMDDDNEAMGIRPFCSTECRARYSPLPMDDGETLTAGDSDPVDICNGLQCETCGKTL